MATLKALRKVKPSDALFGALVLWTVVATVIIAKLELGRRAAAPTASRASATYVQDWRELTARGHSFGPDNAAITMVVFSDFQCPYCRRFASVIDSLRVLNPTLRIVERHFPVEELHAAAFGAALAAECARTSLRYMEMRNALFRETAEVEAENWAALAAKAGIRNPNAFVTCVNEQQHAARVREDMKAGSDIGVQGTPSFTINDSLYRGAYLLADVQQRLRRTAR